MVVFVVWYLCDMNFRTIIINKNYLKIYIEFLNNLTVRFFLNCKTSFFFLTIDDTKTPLTYA